MDEGDDGELQGLNEDLDELHSLLDDDHPAVMSVLGELHEGLEPTLRDILGAARERIGEQTVIIETTTRKIHDLGVAGDAERRGQLAVQALTAVAAIDASINDVAATVHVTVPGPAGTPPVGAVMSFIGKLKTTLGKIHAGLLSLLAKYMKFQNWTVSGALTGGVPWLSGSVTLALTFGP